MQWSIGDKSTGSEEKKDEQVQKIGWIRDFIGKAPLK